MDTEFYTVKCIKAYLQKLPSPSCSIELQCDCLYAFKPINALLICNLRDFYFLLDYLIIQVLLNVSINVNK